MRSTTCGASRTCSKALLGDDAYDAAYRELAALPLNAIIDLSLIHI